MPTHQAIETTILDQFGAPVRRLRSASMNGVKGWYSANQRKPAGSESVGTKPLPRNGSSIKSNGELLALSTLFATMPSATASQEIANEINPRRTARGVRRHVFALWPVRGERGRPSGEGSP